MIDDFHVPDTEYTYDDYGDGKALTLDYISRVEGSGNYSIFFPALDQTHETGQLRSSVVICSQQQISEKLSQCKTLRQWLN